jgi:hypothetical protein
MTTASERVLTKERAALYQYFSSRKAGPELATATMGMLLSWYFSRLIAAGGADCAELMEIFIDTLRADVDEAVAEIRPIKQ